VSRATKQPGTAHGYRFAGAARNASPSAVGTPFASSREASAKSPSARVKNQALSTGRIVRAAENRRKRNDERGRSQDGAHLEDRMETSHFDELYHGHRANRKER
jgi:hypothetical protein